MKGAVLTLDALLALTMLFVMLLFVSTSVTTTSVDDVYLKEVSLDVLTLLEKTGAAKEYVDRGDYNIYSIVLLTPPSVCMTIEFSRLSDGLNVGAIKKPGCEEWGMEYQTTYRTFVSYNVVYLMEMRSWLK